MTATGTAGVATAAVWLGGRDFEMRRVAVPDPGPGEILVRVTTATVCGSDRHTVSGRRSGPCPSVLGHEGVGIVVACGTGAVDVDGRAVAAGDRIVWSVTAPCLACDRCDGGRTAKCRSVLKTGHEPFDGPWPLSGTYATHMIVRRNQPVVVVPATVADGPAATAACAGATVMAALEAAGPVAGGSVLISGAGMLGLVATAAVADLGAGRIEVRDPSPERRELARACGAAFTRAPDAATTATTGSDSEASFDVALEFSGSAEGVAACIRALGIGGTAVLAGSVSPGPPVAIDPESLVRRWLTVRGVHNYEPRHLRRSVEFLSGAGARMPWDQIISPPAPLSALPELFGAPPSAMRDAIAIWRPPAAM